MDQVAVVVFLACIAAALLAGVWFAVRAACRGLGLARRHQILIASAVCEFTREERPHSARIECIFSKVPNTGDPPDIAFQQVSISWENVREDLPGGGWTWAPWKPKSPGDAR